MEHPLNGQYVLRCQLLYYKLRWSVYSYFISFINLFFPLLHVSKFVCQAAAMLIVAFVSSAVAQVFERKIKREEDEEEMDWRKKKSVENVSEKIQCQFVSSVNLMLLLLQTFTSCTSVLANIYRDVHLQMLDEVQHVLTLSMEEKECNIRRAEGDKGEEKCCSSAKNGHGRAKGALDGPLIIIQPGMDFTLQGRNDHLMKVFISQIYINNSISLNVSVLVYESYRDLYKGTEAM